MLNGLVVFKLGWAFKSFLSAAVLINIQYILSMNWRETTLTNVVIKMHHCVVVAVRNFVTNLSMLLYMKYRAISVVRISQGVSRFDFENSVSTFGSHDDSMYWSRVTDIFPKLSECDWVTYQNKSSLPFNPLLVLLNFIIKTSCSLYNKT